MERARSGDPSPRSHVAVAGRRRPSILLAVTGRRTPPALTIALATDAAELAVVADLARAIWNEFYVPLIGQAQVDYMLDRFQTVDAITAQLREGYEYYVLRRDGSPIGYCAVQPQPAERALFLSKFYLRRDARGAGTGRETVAFVERLARERGLCSIWLTVNKRNPSRHAYERMGFRIVADVTMDIGDGFVMDDHRMEKSLSPGALR
jgi:GNAT superfamily N-acetyltransferase